jgi:hypothetical protein
MRPTKLQRDGAGVLCEGKKIGDVIGKKALFTAAPAGRDRTA